MSIIKEIHNFWGIGSKNIHGEEFTGYESVYHQLDKFDKPAFNRDPEGTVCSVFDTNSHRSSVLNLCSLSKY